jgi:hypothetical protein
VKKFILLSGALFAAVLIVSGPPRSSKAEPYFAVMEGAKCSLCHVSPTGAGMRIEHGVGYYKELSLKATKDLIDDEFKGQLTKYFAVGADFRFNHTATIQSPTSNSFTVPQGSIYARGTPIKYFTLYADTDVANVRSREIFGLVHELPYNLWVKFGRINVPYGLRLPDDSSFIRNNLGFTFGSQDLGIELGAEPGPFTLAVAYSNGIPGGSVDDNEQKAVTSSLAWITRYFRLGGSFQWNDTSPQRLLTGGGFFGVHFWRAAVLGEFDLQNIHDKTLGGERTQKVGYGEADVRIIPGLVFKGTYDAIDDELAGSGFHQRIGAGFEIYPIPYLQISTIYRARIGNGALGQDQIFTQIHGYY